MLKCDLNYKFAQSVWDSVRGPFRISLGQIKGQVSNFIFVFNRKSRAPYICLKSQILGCNFVSMFVLQTKIYHFLFYFFLREKKIKRFGMQSNHPKKIKNEWPRNEC